MTKKKSEEDFNEESGLKPSEAAMSLLSRIPDPLPGETQLDYWRRVGPLATQATMIRALAGDHQASAAMFKMVEAPVVSEVQMMQVTGGGGQIQSITGMLEQISSGKLSSVKKR